MLAKREGGDASAITLADMFCRDAARRIESHFNAISHNDDQLMNAVGKAVLAGDMRWLEEGVAWIGPRE